MKLAIFSVITMTSTLLPSEAIAQTDSDLVGRWKLENLDSNIEQIIEFEETATGLQVWQQTPGHPEANSVTLTGNQISFDWSCRGDCHLSGEIFEDGMSGILEMTHTAHDGSSSRSQYHLTKITEPYCSLTGVWEYYSESDFTYNSRTGFGENGPPYRTTVEITEDEDKNLEISGFYNMSSDDGSGTLLLNSVRVLMPLTTGQGRMDARVSDDRQEIRGWIGLSEEYISLDEMYSATWDARTRFTMTRQTECGDDGDNSPSPGDVIEDVLDVIF
jgi:hypothetical protein